MTHHGHGYINSGNLAILCPTMSRLHSAFNHLLPILDEPDYIPVANSTTLDSTADDVDTAFLENVMNDSTDGALNTTYLHNILSDANRVLLSSDDPSPPHLSDDDDPSDSGVVLSALTFYKGRKRGQQCSYNGYLYAHNKTKPNGHSYWDCKDRKLYTPPCKGRLTTLGSDVMKENPHSHIPSLKEVRTEHILSEIRTSNTNDTAANVVRELLMDAPDAVKSSLPTMDNMKKQINDYRAKVRGRPASNPTSAQDVHIPLPEQADSTRGLFVLSDETSSNGKRIVAFTSNSCLSVLDQAHKIT